VNALHSQLTSNGTQLAFVHPGEASKRAETFFNKLAWPGAIHVGDPQATLYRAFELKRGTLTQLFSWRNIQAAIRRKQFFIGSPHGDPFRMSGVFLIVDGRIIHADRHQYASDRTDYAALCQIPATGE